jgi:hypothetical protein
VDIMIGRTRGDEVTARRLYHDDSPGFLPGEKKRTLSNVGLHRRKSGIVPFLTPKSFNKGVWVVGGRQNRKYLV